MSSKDTLQVQLFTQPLYKKLEKLEKLYPKITGGKKRVTCIKIKELKDFLEKTNYENNNQHLSF